MKIRHWFCALQACLWLGSNPSLAQSSDNALELSSCHLTGIKQQVRCGTLEVPENYAKPDGVKISINIAVIPAIDNSDSLTPMMFLAGGPGQAAVELAAPLKHAFSEIIKTRDLLLIDQRGTGKSHPLMCEDEPNKSIYTTIPEDATPLEIKQCLEQLSGDLSQYSSENAIRDFEQVRVALGYGQVNLYGGSYGTRAALVYMRLFPSSIRSVILDSVGPVEVPIGLFGRSARKSFDALIKNCADNTDCQATFPELLSSLETVISRLEKSPQTVKIQHPRLGTEIEFVISKDKFISNLFILLYSVHTRAYVPLLIDQASKQNYLPLAGFMARSDRESSMEIYSGLQLNIICNEDLSRVTPGLIKADTDVLFSIPTKYLLEKACPYWPRYEVDNAFYKPVTADIPTLIFSGSLDPVTPPSNGEYPHKTLPNSRHIVSSRSAHIVSMGGCGPELVNEFLSTLLQEELDATCLDDLPAPSFITNINGDI